MELDKEEQEKMARITAELQEDFVTSMKKHERTDTTLTAAIAALAAIMVMVTQRLVGKDLAVHFICYAISAAFKTVGIAEEELRKDGLLK